MENVNITQILNNALSFEKDIRGSAEKSLEQLALNNFPDFLYKLGSELADESKPTKIRQMAATYMKNSLVYIDQFKDTWANKLEPSVKSQIRIFVLATLASEIKEIRAAAGLVVAGMCKVDLPLKEKWPDLIPSLCQNTYNTNNNLRLAAIECLGYLCEELSPKTIDSESVDNILSALIQNLSNTSSTEDVVKSCLKAFFYAIKFAEKNFTRANELQIIMEAIFMVGNNHSGSDEVLERIAMIFIEIASVSKYYESIYDYFARIAEFTFYIMKNKLQSNQKLTLLAYEVWCSIGDEELKRFKNEANVKQPNLKGYLATYSKHLIEIISAQIGHFDEEDGTSENWTVSKASQYVLTLLVQLIDPDTMEQLINIIETHIASDNMTVKNNSILMFAGCINPLSHRGRLTDFIIKQLNRIMKMLFIDNNQVKVSTSILLMKITKYFPKIFDSNLLATVIPGLTNALPSKNNIAVNVCQCFINIIKGVGDLETKKSSNTISPYFESLSKEMVAHAFREGAYEKDFNLTMACFMVINTLIEYSSHDKQEKLNESLMFFLTQLETTLVNLSNPSTGSEIFLQLQCYFCTILRAIFNKLTRRIPVDTAGKIYLLIEKTFEQRQTVYEEAILALGALAINQGEAFTDIMTNFQKYLLFSIRKYSESSLCQSGLISLLNVVKAIKVNFGKFSEQFIPVLIEVCAGQDVSRHNKTIAITTIGEIALYIGEHFVGFLVPVMNMLFAAAQLAVSSVEEDDDEETEEFLKDLRYELIQCFTCISFAMDDAGQSNLFAQYVPHIFAFFKTISGDNFPQRADTLKAILSFMTDMANSFGSEIKAILEKDFVMNVLSKLKAYKLKRYEMEILQMEEILNLVLN